MIRQSATLAVAALTLSGCISTGGSPFDLIPLSEKVLMTAGAKPQETGSAPISVEELLQRARTPKAEGEADALSGEVSSVIDLSGSKGALNGSALIAIGQYVDKAQVAGAQRVAVETNPTIEPLSATFREAVTVAGMLRRIGFIVEMRRIDSLQRDQIGLRSLGPAPPTVAAGAGEPS